MENLLGMDLGGTKVAFVLSDPCGRFLFEKQYPSPFRHTGRQKNDGTPELEVEAGTLKDLPGLPEDRRVEAFLDRLETDFLQEAKKTVGLDSYAKKGLSLCGRTWIEDGSIMVMGGNTPIRLASDLGNGRMAIRICPAAPNIRAANDGNAAATAQAVFYNSYHGIDPQRTGYMILGTGLGFGVPDYFALTELGHMPAGFVPECLWQNCGCNQKQPTACVENFASGRGIASTAARLLEIADTRPDCLPEEFVKRLAPGKNFCQMAQASVLKNKDHINSKDVMSAALTYNDCLACFVAELAAEVTAYAAICAAYMFGLEIIGAGETVAGQNPWHVANIARKIEKYTNGSTILQPPLRFEPTPLKNPARFGALSLLAQKSDYMLWAEQMADNSLIVS
jgi:glucokinase